MWAQVLKIEIESSNTAAFCFHPFKPLLTTVDGRGVVRIINYQLPPTDSKLILDARAVVNRFHLARGAPTFVKPPDGDDCTEPASDARICWHGPGI